jgi:hypothetical protein
MSLRFEDFNSGDRLVITSRDKNGKEIAFTHAIFVNQYGKMTLAVIEGHVHDDIKLSILRGDAPVHRNDKQFEHLSDKELEAYLMRIRRSRHMMAMPNAVVAAEMDKQIRLAEVELDLRKNRS